MGFDPQNKNQPLMDVHKRTTKVNVAVVIGVAIFLIVATVIMFNYMRSPAETRQEVHEENVQP
jgi:putative flippase GtrA